MSDDERPRLRVVRDDEPPAAITSPAPAHYVREQPGDGVFTELLRYALETPGAVVEFPAEWDEERQQQWVDCYLALRRQHMEQLEQGTAQVQTGNVAHHAFNAAVDAANAERNGISNQRGCEYQDTWALQNVATPRLDCVLREVATTHGGLIDADDLTDEERRLIVVASLADVKTSRWLGPFKRDTPIDETNYLLALTTWLSEYVASNR